MIKLWTSEVYFATQLLDIADLAHGYCSVMTFRSLAFDLASRCGRSYPGPCHAQFIVAKMIRIGFDDHPGFLTK